MFITNVILFATPFYADLSSTKTAGSVGGVIILIFVIGALIRAKSSSSKKKDNFSWFKDNKDYKKKRKKEQASTTQDTPSKKKKKEQERVAKKRKEEAKKELKKRKNETEEKFEARKKYLESLQDNLEENEKERRKKNKLIADQINKLKKILGTDHPAVETYLKKGGQRAQQRQAPGNAPSREDRKGSQNESQSPTQNNREQSRDEQEEEALSHKVESVVEKIKRNSQDLASTDQKAVKTLKKDEDEKEEELSKLTQEQKDDVKTAARMLAQIYSLEDKLREAHGLQKDVINGNIDRLKRLLDAQEKKIKTDKRLIEEYKKAMKTEKELVDSLSDEELQVIHLIESLEQLNKKSPEEQQRHMSWLFYVIRNMTKTNYRLERNIDNFLDLLKVLTFIDQEKDDYINIIFSLVSQWEYNSRSVDKDGNWIFQRN